MSSPYEMSDDSPVYVISVAAELSGLHPQTLRSYDRLGLVSPGRSAGRGRRYSLRDVLLLRDVQRLSHEGVNLEGIRRVLALENELERYRGIIAEMTDEMAQLRPGQPHRCGRVPPRILCVAHRKAFSSRRLIVLLVTQCPALSRRSGSGPR